MFRASSPLLVVLALVGCGFEPLEPEGPQELRSPECDQGLPVIASGQIAVGERYTRAEDATQVDLELVKTDGVDRPKTLTRAVLKKPRAFPISFTLCADSSGLKPEDTINWVVEVHDAPGEQTTRVYSNQPYSGAPFTDYVITINYDGWPFTDTVGGAGGADPGRPSSR
ncbi:hypothetical protein FGE12_07520 [Aggregicoccus sp. 17bor-14]|uniref:hypothetical protein n=1 Tax=Myxococcaceae TaxID=31 RepID=UPI00129CE43E|nr:MULTISPECIES: hypothetical protein [Myxococcaceae]MBF5042242.1 hypothetical protein [Simulacricoccus sp. 17bor-14]MRI88017.1 hypothetical protein [Aggregicoccus sp. 17bor-14]